MSQSAKNITHYRQHRLRKERLKREKELKEFLEKLKLSKKK